MTDLVRAMLGRLGARGERDVEVDPRSGRTRLLLCATALVLAPILLAVAAAFRLTTPADAAGQVARIGVDRDRFLAGGIVLALGFAAFVPGCLALARLSRGRGAGWVTTGVCLVGAGSVALVAGLWARTVLGYAGVAPPVPRAGTVALFTEATGDFVVSLPEELGAAVFLGLGAVAVGLLRARTLPPWQPGLLAGGAVLSFLAGPGWTGAVLSLPLVGGLTVLAVEAARMVSQDGAEPPDLIDLTDEAVLARPVPAPRDAADEFDSTTLGSARD